MEIDPSKNNQAKVQAAARFHDLQQAHKQELETIFTALAKLANLPIEQIEAYFKMLLAQLLNPEERVNPLNQRSRAFGEWVESHRGMNLPTLSDEAISRETIYGERG